MPNPFDKRVPPLRNDVFLRVFGSEDSKPVTLDLINLILKSAGIDPLERIDQISADAALPGVVGAYSPHADVLVIDGPRIIDVEAQSYPLDYASKMLSYAAALLAARTPKGGSRARRPRELPQVIVIMLLDKAELDGADRPITTGRLHWEHDAGCAIATDRILFVMCNLERIKKMYNERSETVATDECFSWLYLLAEGYRDDREVDEVMMRFPSIQKFSEHYDASVDEQRIRLDYENERIAAEQSNRDIARFADLVHERFPEVDRAALDELSQDFLYDLTAADDV